MVAVQNRIFERATNSLRGKCVRYGLFKINRTGRGYVECRNYGKWKGLAKLRCEGHPTSRPSCHEEDGRI